MSSLLIPSQNEQPLASLFEQFSEERKNGFPVDIDRMFSLPFVEAILSSKDISSFDAGVKELRFSGIPDAYATDNWGKIQTYIAFKQWLYEARQAIVARLGIKEEARFVVEKQKRVISPDISAFEYTGNNNLNIKESPNKYDHIFD
jgi:hypothetical protein